MAAKRPADHSKKPTYEDSVFLNVPFDDRYKPIFDAIIFAIFDCGFVARSALESEDAGRARIDKLYEIVAECKYGIHDISRTELDPKSKLPRFNMPLELGIFMGAKQYGTQPKIILILDRERHRYQKFCSDIAGQDIREHNNTIPQAISQVRNWLNNTPDGKNFILPGGAAIHRRYLQFHKELPAALEQFQLKPEEVQFNNYTNFVSIWLEGHP